MSMSTENSDLTDAWTRAIVDVDIDRAKQIYEDCPRVLWQPLSSGGDNLLVTFEAMIRSKNDATKLLGDTVGNLPALGYLLLLDYNQKQSLGRDEQTQSLLYFVCEKSTEENLDEFRWGCGNSILHLASFLGHLPIVLRIVDKGTTVLVSPNGLGFIPKDVAQTSEVANLLSGRKPSALAQGRSEGTTNSDRFHQLRKLAESPLRPPVSLVDRQRSARRHFKPGHLEERKRRVLDEIDPDKTQSPRLMEVAKLAERSAVRRNPLLLKLEQSQTEVAEASKLRAERGLPQSATSPRRSSKIITSLKDRSMVSTSVFRQQQQHQQVPSSPTASVPPTPITPDNLRQTVEVSDDPVTDSISVKTALSDVESSLDFQRTNTTVSSVVPLPPTPDTGMLITHSSEDEDHYGDNSNDGDGDDDDALRRSSMSSTSTLDHCVSSPHASESDAEQWFDSVEEGMRISYESLRESPILAPDMSTEPALSEIVDSDVPTENTEGALVPEQTTDNDTDFSSDNETVRGVVMIVQQKSNDEALLSTTVTAPMLPSSPSIVIYPPPEDDLEERQEWPPVHDHSMDDSQDDSQDDSLDDSLDEIPSTPVTTTVNAYEEDTVDDHAPINEQEKVGEQDRMVGKFEEKVNAQVSSPTGPRSSIESEDNASFGSVTVGVTQRYSTSFFNESTLPKRTSSLNLVPKRPVSEGFQRPPAQAQTPKHGKLYVHVKGVDSILLPMPKEPTFVRCVVSDGRYEYMSRYERLDQQLLMDFECVVDTLPDMIITVSLHVRPDSHVRPVSGWSRFFSTIKRQKETLSGYVHPLDDAIGQSRFAVAHMREACYEKPYHSNFECYNSWYARSARERERRRKHSDGEVLKVVANMSVEMLYLPVESPAAAIPPTLRACDMSIQIRRWHDTCWQSGYLTIRPQGTSVWARRYFRLMGSLLIGYRHAEDQCFPNVQYDIIDAVGLSAATDKVIVALDQSHDESVFKTESICEDNRRGFFRISFPDIFIDCVCDYVEESELWVKTLASMIGRVPLSMYLEERT